MRDIGIHGRLNLGLLWEHKDSQLMTHLTLPLGSACSSPTEATFIKVTKVAKACNCCCLGNALEKQVESMK